MIRTGAKERAREQSRAEQKLLYGEVTSHTKTHINVTAEPTLDFWHVVKLSTMLYRKPGDERHLLANPFETVIWILIIII